MIGRWFLGKTEKAAGIFCLLDDAEKERFVFLCKQYNAFRSVAIGFFKGGAAKLQFFLLFFEKGVQNCSDSSEWKLHFTPKVTSDKAPPNTQR